MTPGEFKYTIRLLACGMVQAQRGASALVYLYLARTGYLRNTAYKWAHMLNNVASAMFGFIYIALWEAVAPAVTQSGDPYNRATMVSMMVLAQTFAWLTTFLPAGLGVHLGIRSGAIATEMARPVPYFPMVLAREVGNVAYQGLYRGVPVAVLFALTVGFPRPASAAALLATVPSVVLASSMGLMLYYTVGITSLWTTEVRWAHWLYHSLVIMLSGGWIPADMLPGWLGQVAPYLPFAVQAHYPIRIYLGLSGPEGLLVQAVWVLVMSAWCVWVTRQAFRRVVVQGG